jgi:hypothetical protein
MGKDIDKVVSSILEGTDVKSALGQDVVQEGVDVNASAVVKAIKKLKSGFSKPELEKALSVVKDEKAREGLVEYFTEIEDEDGLVSSFLDGDVTDKEMQSAIQSFVDDVLNESKSKDAEPVVEGMDQDAKKLVKALQRLTPGEFTGDDLESAIEDAGISEDVAGDLYDYLADLEEEEGSVSQLASGDITANDFMEILMSFLED